MFIVFIGYETTATACRTLTFIVRIFVNDTVAIAVWTSFHVCTAAFKRVWKEELDNESA